jgi:hypothetical protein
VFGFRPERGGDGEECEYRGYEGKLHNG